MRFPGQPAEDLAALGQRVLPVVEFKFKVRVLFKTQFLLCSSHRSLRKILCWMKMEQPRVSYGVDETDARGLLGRVHFAGEDGLGVQFNRHFVDVPHPIQILLRVLRHVSQLM